MPTSVSDSLTQDFLTSSRRPPQRKSSSHATRKSPKKSPSVPKAQADNKTASRRQQAKSKATKPPKSESQRSYRFCVSIRATTVAALRAHITDARIESGRRVPVGEVVAEALEAANLTAPSLDTLAPGRGGNRVTVSFYMPKGPSRALLEAVDRRKMDRRAVRNISDVVDVALAAMLGA